MEAERAEVGRERREKRVKGVRRRGGIFSVDDD